VEDWLSITMEAPCATTGEAAGVEDIAERGLLTSLRVGVFERILQKKEQDISKQKRRRVSKHV
jgi:hypothetical protein